MIIQSPTISSSYISTSVVAVYRTQTHHSYVETSTSLAYSLALHTGTKMIDMSCIVSHKKIRNLNKTKGQIIS